MNRRDSIKLHPSQQRRSVFARYPKTTIFIGVMVWIMIIIATAGSGSPTNQSMTSTTGTSMNQEPSTTSDVTLAGINAETDCAALQRMFDGFVRAHEINRDRGTTDAARQQTEYMNAAHKRMEQLGCYK